MADPLTLAASAVGITSLAIQLLEKAKTIHELWTLVRDAPAELKRLLEDLEDVSQLLQEVIDQSTKVDPNSRAILFVRKCESRLDDLRTIVGSMDSSRGNGKRAFVKRVVKVLGNDQKVLRMRNNLQETINYLSLALQILQSRQTTNIETLEHRALVKMEAHAAQSQQSTRILSEISTKSYQHIVRMEQELVDMNTSIAPYVASRSAGRLKPECGLFTHQNRAKSQNNGRIIGSRRYTSWRIPLMLGSLIAYRKTEQLDGDEGADAVDSNPTAKEYGFNFQPSWLFHSGFMAAFKWEFNAHAYRFHQTLQPIFYLPEDHPLFVGAESGDAQAVQRYLTEFGTANVSCMYGNQVDDNRSLLQHAILNYQFEIARILVENNADINYIDDDGATAIVYSMVYCNAPTEFVRLLLIDKQGDPSDTDLDNYNCWHNTDMSTTLWQILAEGSVPTLQQRDVCGYTPLHRCCLSYRTEAEVCVFAVRSGADVNSPFPGGNSILGYRLDGASPLHLAIVALQCPAKGLTLSSLPNGLTQKSFVNPSDELADVYIPGYFYNHSPSRVVLTANLHAISECWGSPTDIAKLSNNLGMWYDILEECGLDLEAFLAEDLRLQRTQHFDDMQIIVRDHRKTRNFLLSKWHSVIRFAEKAGLKLINGIFEAAWDYYLPRHLCVLCEKPYETECSHAYYLNPFVLISLSGEFIRPELAKELAHLTSDLFEDLQALIEYIQDCSSIRTDWYDADIDVGMLNGLDQISRARKDSGLGFCRFLRNIYQQDQDQQQDLGTTVQLGEIYGNGQSDNGDRDRSEGPDARKAHQQGHMEAFCTNRCSGEIFHGEGQQKHVKDNHSKEGHWDEGYWFLLQLTMELFFHTWWPCSVDVDLEELLAKLRMRKEEVSIPGAWPTRGV
ncbi:MAG: hypothetical protein M1812_005938 [Candelaria pacifica]|nr:MAG: hypothetical protein M1812_005938 [Candelaria pacifica]